jgi:hypothetical protein
LEDFEMRHAVIRTARKARMCDSFCCETRITVPDKATWRIQRGDQYAYLSHGIAICARHYLPTDVVDA